MYQITMDEEENEQTHPQLSGTSSFSLKIALPGRIQCDNTLTRSRWCLVDPPSRLPCERCTPCRLAGSRSRFYGWDGPGDRPIYRQENLLAVMMHHERRTIEQAVRRCCCC